MAARRLHPLVRRALTHGAAISRRSRPRLRAPRWDSMEHPLDADVLVDVRPMNTLAGADEPKARSLLGGRISETPRPREGNADDAPVGETRDDLVRGDADMLDARLDANRSVHAKPPEWLRDGHGSGAGWHLAPER